MRLGIFGGSFNPVHVGHLRIAIEVRETLELDQVDMVPVASPPHKEASDLLPFWLRCLILKAAVKQAPGLALNDLEALLPEPSYTHRTLSAYREILPDAELYFILGASDLLLLDLWHRGREMHELANFVVVPRFGKDLQAVADFVPRFWPDAERLSACAHSAQPSNCQACWRLPSGNLLQYVHAPGLDVSATDIRYRFLDGRSLVYLVPSEVEQVLMERREEVRRIWSVRPEGKHTRCRAEDDGEE
ncbi:nicotinate (nicotinamide) nucleotide adenylyltransferase [Desulfocurvibacter africanus]|uniref:nicotinate (nicotinamide) nucleotide adenylyltransferase n=1 Tax=Desulfocurvibacter africanus TaxID=873 RepID=UPI0004199CC9|nr:nicotinate (nicotinamide) nucleotide adenylyltransferase [Desulfocurvibacter africanus]